MADKKISQLPAATTPLGGTEQIPLVQSGVTKEVTVAGLFDAPTITSPTLVTPDLGTPSAVNLTNATHVPVNEATGTLAVAHGGSGVTTSTGSGSVVLSNSPTLVTPALGTPASVDLTNASNVPMGQATGTLAVAHGGSGQTTYTDGQLLIGNSSNGLTKSTLTAGSNVTITNGNGSITIAATTGGGDVVGPASATNNDIALFDGTTGKLIKDSGKTISTANTANTVVARDVAGDFSAGTITATLNGIATNVGGTVAIANGGTGQTTQQAAMTALAGAATSGQFLRGNGTNVVMSAIQAADVPTLNQNTTGTAGGLSSTLAIGSGGTGQTTQQAAMTALAGAATSGQFLRGNGTNVVMAAIQAADVPTLNQNTTGTAGGLSSTLAVGSGGTGQTTYTDGQLLIGNTATGGLSKATLTAGTNVSIVNGNGTITISATGGSGGGDVSGPGSATDNALTRFDGTTGKIIQNSTVTLDDSGNLASPLSIQLGNGAAVTNAAGKLWYDNSTGSVNVGMGNGVITQQIGEELFVYGKASSAISGSTTLQAIYKTGTVGASGVITFAPTVAGITDTSVIIGVGTEDLALNAFGRITAFGVVHGVDTSGATYSETWADNDDIWYNPTTGGLTKTKPVAPNVKMKVGTVITASGGGSGSFQVLLEYGSVLGGTDSNVQLTSPANNNLLQYDSTAGYWKNVAASAVTVGSAATLTTPRAIYGNNFDGSAALTQIIASTYGGTGNGFTKFTGPTTSEKTFTLPDANATLARTDAGQTFTGAQTFSSDPVLNGGTANGVVYLNGSKVATSGSALAFDGANLGIGTTPLTNTKLTIPVQSADASTVANFGNINIVSSSTTGYPAIGYNVESGNASNVFRFVGADNVSWIQFIGNSTVFARNSNTPSAGGLVTSAESMRIDGSGNVGIGTSSPTAIGTYPTLDIRGAAGGGSRFGYATVNGYLYANSSGAYCGVATSHPLIFDTGGSERMRIDSSGNVGIGTASPGTKLQVVAATNAGISVNDDTVNTIIYNSTGGTSSIGTTTNHQLNLFANNSARISITGAGVVSFNNYGAGTLSTNSSGVISASDGRYKQKTRKVENGLAIIMQLAPTYYRWNEGTPFHTEHEELGFIAQEVAAVIPEASPDPEVEDKFKNYHDRAVMAMLVKAIQEQQAQIEQLRAEVTALKAPQ